MLGSLPWQINRHFQVVFIRCSELGVFGRIFVEPSKGGGETAEWMIDCASGSAGHRVWGHVGDLSG